MDKGCWLVVREWINVGLFFCSSVRLTKGTIWFRCLEGTGVSTVDLSYGGAITTMVSLEGRALLLPHLCTFWSPHSFTFTRCAPLGVAKDERDFLGKWTRTQSNSLVPVARRCSSLQRHRGAHDQIAETEMSAEVEEYLTTRDVPNDQLDPFNIIKRKQAIC